MSMKNDCHCAAERNCTCGDCGTEFIMLTRDEHANLRQYILALERTRADLMSSNENLYEKCGALERGQLELQKEMRLTEENKGSNDDAYLHLSRELAAQRLENLRLSNLLEIYRIPERRSPLADESPNDDPNQLLLPNVVRKPDEVESLGGFRVNGMCEIMTGPYRGSRAVVTKIEVNAGARNGWFTVKTIAQDIELLFAGEEISPV